MYASGWHAQVIVIMCLFRGRTRGEPPGGSKYKAYGLTVGFVTFAPGRFFRAPFFRPSNLIFFGALPENTNFGIKSSVLKSFMEGNGIENVPLPLDYISSNSLEPLAPFIYSVDFTFVI